MLCGKRQPWWDGIGNKLFCTFNKGICAVYCLCAPLLLAFLTTHTCTHTHTHMHAHAHTHMHAHIHMHAHMHAHARTHNIHAHKHMHAHMHAHTHTHARTHTDRKITVSEEKFTETRTRHKIFMNYFCLYYISRCNLHVSATSFTQLNHLTINQLNHVNVEMYSLLRQQRWCGNDAKCMYRTGIINSHTHLHIQKNLQPSPLPSFPVPKTSGRVLHRVIIIRKR